MRVAYLVNRYPAVSHTFIRREIQALERQGFQIMRISLRGWDGQLADPEDVRERERTRFVLRGGLLALLPAVMRCLFTSPIRFFRAFALAWRMGRRSERPFLVHLAYLAEACRVEPWLRVAHIQHVHAHFGTNSADVAMLVHVLGGPQWSVTIHGPEEFDKAASLSLSEKIYRSAFAVAISSYGRSQLYRLVEPQYWSKLHIVHCGLDAEFLADTSIPTSAERRLVCVGRLCEQKGQLLLIEAAAYLAAQNIQYDLVLAGDGEMRDDIQSLITRHNLQNRVRITGWISGKQVRDELLAARALVLPSLAEGLPVVIMEAMALRRPVISTFVAGIPELVVSGKHGWLLPAGDTAALAQALQECLDAPLDKLACMGNAARDRVLARHNADVEAAKLADLFRAFSSKAAYDN